MQAPKTDSRPRELVPEGNHVATLYNITYIGTIETPYVDEKTGEKKKQNRLRLTFELPNEMRKFEVDGETVEKPMVISKEMTFSMYKGSLTAQLRTISHALIGQALTDEEAETFDADDLLGMSCMVEVTHEEYEGSKYSKAVTFSSIPKGIEKPNSYNEPKSIVGYELSDQELNDLPEFISNKIKSSEEWKSKFDPAEIERKKDLQAEIDARRGATPSDDIKPEDIPF